MTTVHDFSAQTLAGEDRPLADFRGQVLLIVNVASKCGFTPQYAGLEALQARLEGRGFQVLGFPCNQFGAQEPGDAAEIGAFCGLTYGVTFPMFAKIAVNGPGAHPLWRFLKREKRGILGSAGIKWNFTKFLIGRDGRVLARYAPKVEPGAIEADIEQALAE
jgi:glutathione peroxidase